jgi:hypothetical protein
MRVFALPAPIRGFAAVAAFTASSVLGAACSTGASPDAPPPAGTAGTSSGGQPSDDQPMSLAFERPDTETVTVLVGREQTVLRVRAQPAKVYHLRFALPTSGGDPLDAVLDQAEADTGPDGLATVKLTAPSAPTTFEVRASSGSRIASLPVTVQDAGFATLQVQPLYAGFRAITTWVASAYTRKTCAELSGIPPEDGPIQTLPAAAVAAPQLSDVPAGVRLAVTLRSGHFVGGCASVEKVPPGPVDKPQIVQVTVLDRPIDLSASPLAVSFSASPNETTWTTLLESSGSTVLQALLGTSNDDVDALLDAMREASDTSRQVFETTRKAENWDDLVRLHWGPAAASKLRDTCAGWLAAGRQKFATADHLFTGTLDPIVQPDNPLDQRHADFTLLSVGGLEGAESGFVDRAQVSWSASADDTLVIGTDLYFVQSRFAEALAEAAALVAEEGTEATSAEALLGEVLDCPGLSRALSAAGADTELAYAGCDTDCLTALCQSAATAIWRRGGDASGLSPARLSITATGAARVGDAAEVVGVGGTWLGALSADDTSATMTGTLTAVSPAKAR